LDFPKHIDAAEMINLIFYGSFQDPVRQSNDKIKSYFLGLINFFKNWVVVNHKSSKCSATNSNSHEPLVRNLLKFFLGDNNCYNLKC
jgi:hypothetical protein